VSSAPAGPAAACPAQRCAAPARRSQQQPDPPLARPPCCAARGAPIEAIAILGLLGSLVGIYSLPGVFVVCLVVPAQYYFGFRIIKNKVANAHNVNERFSIVQEVLPAMKLVKYYAWERFFESTVGWAAAACLACCRRHMQLPRAPSRPLLPGRSQHAAARPRRSTRCASRSCA
jgi:hypothetical protein